MRIVVFEDASVRHLEPITLSRAAYTLQCGSLCLADWLSERTDPVQGRVRPHLRAWQSAEYPHFAADPTTRAAPFMLINARLVPCASTFEILGRLLRAAQPGIVFQGEHLAAAILPPEAPTLSDPQDPLQLAAFLREPSIAALPILEHRLALLNFPHDLVSQHIERVGENLERRIQNGNYREVRDGVFLAENAQLADLTHTDAALGPIVAEAGSRVKPFACLRGPLHLGEMSCVSEHSLLKPGVTLGPFAKVGGEVEASVIEAYTNKQHTGYLGHSYVGRWVNLGAGTSNSNLKNTYGTIRMEIDGRRLDTGMQFMGCVIGDYTKTAINTAIFTGRIIGCCSMVYGFVTTDVPSFTNYARSFGELTELTPQIMAQTQKRVFLRRGIEQQSWHIRLLESMYEVAAAGRQLADRPVSL